MLGCEELSDRGRGGCEVRLRSSSCGEVGGWNEIECRRVGMEEGGAETVGPTILRLKSDSWANYPTGEIRQLGQLSYGRNQTVGPTILQ
jgi:hypothetical protein